MDVRATFAGFLNQTQIADAYAAADVLVLPSDYGETWGLVVNEAMASGLPAIVSDAVGCAPDLVLPGRTGLRHPLGDTAALGRAIARLADDPSVLGAMSREASAHVQGYSIGAAANGIREAAALVARRA